MRQKTKCFQLGIMAFLVAAAGILCSCESLHYTNEQEDKISNYAAQIVLKHDKKYRYRFLPGINDKGITQEESQAETEIPTVAEEATTVTVQEIDPQQTAEQGGDSFTGTGLTDINEAIHVADGIQISYTGCDVVTKYPADDAADMFVIKAVTDSTLLVVKFDVKNTTSQDMNVNFMENGRRYKGIVNDSKKYNAQLTLLLDAMNTFEGVIAAGETKQLVLIFQTQLGSVSDVSQLSVSVVQESGEEKVISLK